MDRRLTVEEVRNRYRAAAHSTRRADRERTDSAIATLYDGAGLEAPTVVWGHSPREACLAADETVGHIACETLPGDRIARSETYDATEDEVTHIVLPWVAPLEAYPEDLWRVIGFGHGLRTHPADIGSFREWEDTSVRERWAMVRFVENVGWWRLHRTHAFVSERPINISLDHLGRPHGTADPAVVFRDGWTLFAVDGIRLPDWTVRHPERITPEDIDGVANAELRRVLVTLSGDRYIEHRGSLLHADGWGELWEVPEVNGRFVRVTDATPLPDGTRKRYWLRVPTSVSTAHAAVAWTFGLTEYEYVPELET